MGTESPAICALPWTHFFVSNGGVPLPCCYSQNSSLEAIESVPRLKAGQGFEEMWNSEERRALRREMREGRRPRICEVCFHLEDAGLRSRRQDANREFAGVLPDLIRATTPDGSAPIAPLSYDFRLGNTCNLKCRMCHPASSAPLAREWRESEDPEFRNAGRWALAREPWHELPGVWREFSDHSGSLRSLYFAGGEPALITKQRELLEELIAGGRSRGISLECNTNLSRLLPDLDRLLENFRSVKLAISVDGFGELNRYIRFPSDWENLARNLAILDGKKRDFPNLELIVTTTVQAYNILRLTDLFEYFERSGLAAFPRFPHFNLMQFPPSLSIRVLPGPLKKLARSRLEAYREKSLSDWSESDRYNWGELEKMLEIMDQPASAEDERKFWRVTKWYDARRSQKIAAVLPEFADFDPDRGGGPGF